MSARETCFGCEGKGWICFVSSRRTTPFLDKITSKPVDGLAVLTEECETATCPICRGAGHVKPTNIDPDVYNGPGKNDGR